jgi:hypothetical protein
MPVSTGPATGSRHSRMRRRTSLRGVRWRTFVPGRRSRSELVTARILRRWRVAAVLLTVAFALLAATWIGPDVDSSPHRPIPAAGAMPTLISTTSTTEHHVNAPTVPTPTPASPLRILVVGDSLGIDLGESFVRILDTTGFVTTTIAARGDTGLANQGYFDWPAQLPPLLTAARPDIVVVLVGANDDQGMYVGAVPVSTTSQAWSRAYARRVDRVLAASQQAGARTVWVGLPPMEDPELDAAMRRVNRIDELQTRRYPDALYLPPPAALVTCSGQYKEFAVEASGETVQLRTPDHVHLTWSGADALADGAIGAIDRRWHLALGRLTQIAALSSPCSGRSNATVLP